MGVKESGEECVRLKCSQFMLPIPQVTRLRGFCDTQSSGRMRAHVSAVAHTQYLTRCLCVTPTRWTHMRQQRAR